MPILGKEPGVGTILNNIRFITLGPIDASMVVETNGVYMWPSGWVTAYPTEINKPVLYPPWAILKMETEDD